MGPLIQPKKPGAAQFIQNKTQHLEGGGGLPLLGNPSFKDFSYKIWRISSIDPPAVLEHLGILLR
ncbi:hypothetical protein J3P91_18635 [Pseudomonas sp. Z4-7]|uniref:hypothetical protein n=1 Tax=Pseudomonas sp. Z4-7 TaxID=2817413 RepID=UPI003DA93EA8